MQPAATEVEVVTPIDRHYIHNNFYQISRLDPKPAWKISVLPGNSATGQTVPATFNPPIRRCFLDD